MNFRGIKSTYVTVDQLAQTKDEITNTMTQGGSSARADITVPGRLDISTMCEDQTTSNINFRRGACSLVLDLTVARGVCHTCR